MNQMLGVLFYTLAVAGIAVLLLALPAWAFYGWVRQSSRVGPKRRPDTDDHTDSNEHPGRRG